MIEGEVTLPLAGLPPAKPWPSFSNGRGASSRAIRCRARSPTSSRTSCASAHQVAGLPLGIELAASWVEHFSVGEIGRSLAAIEIAPQQAGGIVSRHHSLDSVFEYSWRLLSPSQQQILAGLSIFRGGFDRVAALAVAAAGLSELSALIGHSLVQRIAAGRYDLHPLIQELAATKLSTEQAAALAGKYSHHYLTALMATERMQRAATLQIEFENIRSAWQHAVQAGDTAIIEPVTTQFGEFIAQFGFIADGAQLFAGAVARFEGAPECKELVAHLLYQQWVFVRGMRGLVAASDLSHRILSLTSDPELLALAHTDLANHYAEAGAWDLADLHFDASEALLQGSANLSMYIDAVESRIHINALHFRGDYAAGIARLQELLLLLEQATQADGSAMRDVEKIRFRVNQSLVLVATRYGDYALAIRCCEQNLAWNSAVAHQQQRGWILLDLALAEQFAGLYPAAIAHNLEALAITRKVGATDDEGLVQANLCLTMRQSGDWEQGLAYGLAAIAVLEEVKWARGLGQARNRVGHTLLALERWADAYAAYEEALLVWAPLQHPNRYEALAGRAVAAARLGKQEDALALVAEVLEFTATAGLAGIVEPVLLLLNCATVLGDAGQTAQARDALLQADAWVQTIAGRISDDAVRAAFLHQRPDNQRLCDRLAAAQG
jgi:tetratricopeptide (TPR) repeat protein